MSWKTLYHYYMSRLYWRTKPLRTWLRKKLNRPYVKTWRMIGASELLTEGDMIRWAVSGTRMIVTKVNSADSCVTLTYSVWDPDKMPVAPLDMAIVTGTAHQEK